MEVSVAKFFYEVLKDYGPPLALVLQASLLYRFLDRRNRDYPLAIVFILLLFLLTLATYFFTAIRQLLLQYTTTTFDKSFLDVYSAGDLLMHLLLLGLMLQLTRKTLNSLELGTRIVIPLALISCLIGISAYQYFAPDPRTIQLLRTRQVVSFWMVLLNLYWWTLLLRKRQLDRRVLLLSAGIGLMMTGQVIGDGILSIISRGARQEWAGVGAILVMYLTHFACLYAWYNAFSPSYALVPAKKLNKSLT